MTWSAETGGQGTTTALMMQGGFFGLPAQTKTWEMMSGVSSCEGL